LKEVRKEEEDSL